MRSPNDHPDQRPRRGGWVIAAALLMIIGGVIGLATIVGPDLLVEPLLLLLVGLPLLSIAAGIGLLGLRGWARLTALSLSVLSVFLYAANLEALAGGNWVAWFGVLSNLVVLFAVVRRWPTGSG